MTERYEIAVLLIVLLVGAIAAALWVVRSNAQRDRRDRRHHRIEVETRDRS